MNLPTVKQLRYFVALEEHQHFGKAAEACFVSQSAFSVAIRELESGLGVQLVDRTNRKVTVSQLGREVATQARLCIRDMEALVEVARGNREALAGPLRLGVIPTIAPFLLPRVLPALGKAHPRLQLLLREETTQRIYDKLMDGQLDLMLLALPYELRNVELMPLFKDRFRLACRAKTKLVDPENYRFNRLNAESVLLLEDGHCLRDHAISACRIRNLDKVSRFSASSLLTLVEMVDADLGITYLPEMAEGSSILSGTRVKTYPMRDDAYRNIGLAWRRGSGRVREFRLLGEFIREHAG
jgi:LysR family hydrogen peroxide-inducible transcriptional activator